MVFTSDRRKNLNALFISRFRPEHYFVKPILQSERLLLDELPKGAIELCSISDAIFEGRRYAEREGTYMPVLIRVLPDASFTQMAYDVNYFNPFSDNDIALLSRYMSHTKVYTIY